MSGRTTKSKINRTLVNGIHLRNEVFGDVYEVMEYFDSVPKGKAFEDVANHITEGINQAEQTYYNQSMDFYKIHFMDAELRTNKLQGLIDKDSARSIYKMIDGVLKFMKQTNHWPDDEGLIQWMDDFMEYYKSS
jgi:transposase